MRQKNLRAVFAGSLLLAMAVAFFFLMLSMAGKSTDPAELMRPVGMISGVVSGLATTIMVVGGIGKKVQPHSASDA